MYRSKFTVLLFGKEIWIYLSTKFGVSKFRYNTSLFYGINF